ncbi:hypothetical protein BH10PSE13_BH10PSE13_19770 [soil metagenome]
MTETESPPEITPLDPAAAERAARQRFYAIGWFRLSGALILVFGIAIAQQHFGWVTGQKAKIMGVIIASVGFIQMVLVPRILIRAFATPKAKP